MPSYMSAKDVAAKMQGKVKPDDIKALIQNSLEPLEPADTILAVLKENEGKRLTKLVIDKLKDRTGDQTLRISCIASMTSIEWGPFVGRLGSLLMAYQITNVVIDTAFVLEHNVAYYEARDKRNAQRRALLADDPRRWQEIADTINRFQSAYAALHNELTDDSLDVIQSELESLAGVRDDQGNAVSFRPL
jgi:hypothetical protein